MNRAGMTLLELVVALTITGAALAAGYGAFAGVIDRRETMTAAADSVTRAAGVRRTLSEWIGAARVGLGSDGPDFRGLDGTAGTAADDELTFTTDAPTPLGDFDTLIRLSVDRDPGTAERGLVATLSRWDAAGTVRIALAPEVDGFDVRYGSRVFGGIRWLPSWLSRSVLPRGVEITLHPAAGLHAVGERQLPGVLRLRSGWTVGERRGPGDLPGPAERADRLDGPGDRHHGRDL